MDMPHMVRPMMPEYHANPHLVTKIVQQLKTNGHFDEMRRECLADIDTKPAFQNLKQRVEGHVNGILSNYQWSPSLNKNQLRSKIRESVMQSGILNEGVDRILHQVFDANVHSCFMPKIFDFIKENGDELKKEFMPVLEAPPPPADMQMMVNPPFIPPPVPVPPDVPEQLPLPPIPAQPPPPESPTIPSLEESVEETKSGSPKPTTPEAAPPAVIKEEVKDIEEQYYVKDIAPEDVIVKAIKTPSPQRSPEEESTPMIPEDAVNPLRNLIQSLLTSKSIISPQENEKKAAGYSPTIDPSQIEAFTDEEESPNAPHRNASLDDRVTPSTLQQGEVVPSTPEGAGASPISPLGSPPSNEPGTPPSPYSPISDGHEFEKDIDSGEEVGKKQRTRSFNSDYHSYGENHASRDAPHYSTASPENYDPAKFTYEERSHSPDNRLDTTPGSAPSPTSLDTNPDGTDKGAPSDTDRYYSEESKLDTDLRQAQVFQAARSARRSPSSSDSDSSSGSASPSQPSGEELVEQEVEEMVEEIEVVEEFVSEEKSESEKSVEVKEKKKKKKSKKKKSKKARKRKHSRSSSVSSGEITSSGELTSDSSSNGSRPTRPNVVNRPNLLELQEIEDRRRAMEMEEGHRERPPFWTNTESSSDYLSSPGRIRHPFSPPRRLYSPEFMRYESERNIDMGYGPPPGLHFRDRHMYPPGRPGDFGPPMRHRFSPPPGYRRSPPPPHRFSPGPRMDYPPRPPHFGSPRSPPRRLYSPPHHMMGGFPGDIRPGFPHPHHMHCFGSPPHPMMNPHRRPSRSPPPHPGMRMEEMPGPSKHMRF